MNIENPYDAPGVANVPGSAGAPVEPRSPGQPLAAGSATFGTVAALLAGACFAQAAAGASTLTFNRAAVPEALRGFCWTWACINLGASLAGAVGTHHTIRRGVASQPATLAFLLAYSVALRLGGASFGWPFQLHIGMGFGGGGAGLNLLGVGLACWWFRLRSRERRLPTPLPGSDLT